MTQREPLTTDELEVLATAAILHPAGFIFDESRERELATCEGLVERGSLVAIKGVDGGFQLSAEAAEAQRAPAAVRAEGAALN